MANTPAQGTSSSKNTNRNNVSKRKLLFTLGGLGGSSLLPNDWIKPVVNSVTLPAHGVSTVPPPPPSPELMASCSVTVSTDTLEIVGSGFLTTPLDVTVTNTGEVPLTGQGNVDGFSIVANTAIGPIGTGIMGQVPSPLMPGESAMVSLFALTITTCSPNGLLFVRYNSTTASCQTTVNVICEPLVPN